MKQLDRVAYYLVEKPSATNTEIAEALEISEGNAKKLVHELKKKGVLIPVNGLETRTFDVNTDRLLTKAQKDSLTRREYVERMLTIIYDAIEQESQIDKIVSAGNLIIKLLDRL